MGEMIVSTQRIVVKTDVAQRIVVEDRVATITSNHQGLEVVLAGPVGPPGIDGTPGAPGTNAGKRWYGVGVPGTIVGAAPGDEYVDTETGTLYILQ